MYMLLGALLLGAAILLTVEFKILSDTPDLDGRLRRFVQSSACTLLLMVLFTFGLAAEIGYFLTIASSQHIVLASLWMVGVPLLALLAAIFLVKRHRKRPPMGA